MDLSRLAKETAGKTVQAEYDLEYGSDIIEIHEDAIKPGQKVVVADDIGNWWYIFNIRVSRETRRIVTAVVFDRTS